MAIFNNADSDTLITGSGDNDSFSNSGDNVTITSGDGNDSIESYYGENVSINAGNGNDYIWNGDYENGGDNGTIFGGDGDDYIRNWSNNSYVDGGNGNDRIDNILDNSTIIGGAGNDSIFTEYNTTVTAGTGDDTVRFNTAGYHDETLIFNYAEGDGNDVIEIENGSVGINEIIINITSGALDSTSKASDGDILLKVGSGSINLKYLNDERITVKDASGKVTVIKEGSGASISDTETEDSVDSKLITLTEGADTYRNSVEGATIEALGGNDYVENINGKEILINGGVGDDTIFNNGGHKVLIDGGDGNDHLTNNIGNYATLSGGNGNDYVWNRQYIWGWGGVAQDTRNNASINSGSGDDTIYNDGSNSVIDASDGNDKIYNDSHAGIDDVVISPNNVTINGGTGDDLIENSGDNVTFQYSADDGNDLIEGFNESSTLQIGDGSGTYSKETVDNDIIVTVGDGSITLSDAATLSTVNIIGTETGDTENPNLIMLTENNDTYSNSIEGATIQALGGNDTIYNGLTEYSTVTFGSSTVVAYGNSSVSIDSGDGDDYINNEGSYSTIYGGTGKGTIYNGKTVANVTYPGESNVTISGGNDEDYIYNTGDTVSIDGGAGNDSILGSSAEDVTIDGGDGDDVINADGANILIWGGTGNDSVNLNMHGWSYIYEYADGDGEDVIGSDVTAINITKGTVSSSLVDGDDLILNIGDGSIRITDGANKNIPVVYGDYGDYWRDKRIENYTENTLIGGGDNSDSVRNHASNATINAGKGRDTILNENWNGSEWNAPTPDNVLMNGEGGDDVIQNEGGANVSINGGDGNDEISNAGDKSYISGGNGNDTITNYVFNTVSVNDDNMGEEESFSGSNSTIDAGDGNDYISNSTNETSILGGAGNDTIINEIETYLNLTTSDGVAFTESDTTSYFGLSSTINGGAGDDFISLESANNVLIQYAEGEGNDTIAGFNETSTLQIGDGNGTYSTSLNGGNIIVKVGNGSITLSDAAELENINISGVYEGDTDADTDTDTDADTDTDTDTDTDSTISTIDNNKNSSVMLGNEKEIANASKRTKPVKIVGNDLDNSIVGGSGNDTLDGAAGDDTLTGNKGKDVFIYNGGKDVITDYTEDNKIRVNNFSSYEEVTIEDGDIIFDYDDINSLTIKGGADKAVNINSVIKYYTEDGIINGKKKAITLLPDTEDVFDASKDKNYSKLVTIDASEVNDELLITGNKKANYIVASKSNTTLNGGKGKDTLVGGEGEDIFIYENKSGNKIIRGYNFDDDDFISLGGGAEISQVTTKNKNVVLKVGSNTITIEDMNKFKFAQDGKIETYDDGKLISGESVTLASDFKGTFRLEDNGSYNHISAELGKKNVELIGDAGDNILTGGKGKDTLFGGDNDDTLWGGKGNDVLWGGDDDADTFIYRAGEGTDTIMDYNFDDGDLLQILDKKGNKISKGAVKKWATKLFIKI